MRSVRLGDQAVSVVGLGCNNFGRRIDAAETERVVHAALDAGVTLFDTADVYGATRSEEYLGRALASRRDEAVIATKFGAQLGDDERRGGASPRWIAHAVEVSLRRLGTDRIDLYQLHTPDPDTPIGDTLEALDRLARAGKVRNIGCSNFSADQIDEAERAAGDLGAAMFVSVQNRYSLLRRDPEHDGVIDACNRHGLGLLPYFPLASGMLTGKYRRGAQPPPGSRMHGSDRLAADLLTDETFDVVERLERFAADRHHTLLELAISWLASQPVVASVIAGATKPEQVRANAAAADWHLDRAELAEIDEITSVSAPSR